MFNELLPLFRGRPEATKLPCSKARSTLTSWTFLIFLFLITTACTSASDADAGSKSLAVEAASALQSLPQPIPLPDIQLSDLQASSVQAARVLTTTPYLEKVDIVLDEVNYLPLVEEAIPLESAERDMLAQNGFVVADRVSWKRFVEAYAWIYWKDLPVLVTTDAILHALHQSYVDLLKDLEQAAIKPQLVAMLNETSDTVARHNQDNSAPELEKLYTDVAAYLAVAQHLLEETESQDPAIQRYVTLATQADQYGVVTLFGMESEIDFTLFKPRAHYAEIPALKGYFRAMSWLGQVDYRFVAYDPLTSEATLNADAIAAATILRNAIDETDRRIRWSTVNGILEVLIGRSDNTTLLDLDRFLADAELSAPAQVLSADEETLLNLLTTNDYGQQRITGQLIKRDYDNDSDESIPRPTSFLLLGQRFAIDSFILSELVYDRLMLDGEPIKRPLPSPLDAMAALGNARARTHLEPELAQYNYQPHLDTLETTIGELPNAFWRAPVYNQWVGLLRSLNIETTDASYPQAMQTEAWADKMLQTQLGSWTQLRHDNILYVKQSFTTEEVTCEYPAGYVEPYPEFYRALGQLAHDVRQVLTSIPVPAADGSNIHEPIILYFQNLEEISSQLQILAEKELRLEEFTAEEELFLKSMVKREVHVEQFGCGGPTTEEYWDGWYVSLFYERDENPALVADVHTNPTRDIKSTLYPPRVLHAATGPVSAQFMVVDTDEGPAIYVGPAYTYFEVITTGNATTPPERLTDESWRERLANGQYPTAPAWTQSFRYPPEGRPNTHTLPRNVTIDYPKIDPRPWVYLPMLP